MTVLVGICGMPGSGKSMLGRKLEDADFLMLTLSDFLKELQDDPSDTGFVEHRWEVSHTLRTTLTETFLAERAWSEVEQRAPRYAVIDGIRTLAECAYFSQRAPFDLVAFQRSPELRYKRILGGNALAYRADPSKLVQLDAHELSLGVGAVLSVADFVWFSSAGEDELSRDVEAAARVVRERARSLETDLSRRVVGKKDVINDHWSRYSTLQSLLAARS